MSQNSDIEAKRKELRLEPEQLNSLILAAAQKYANASLEENSKYFDIPGKHSKSLKLRYIDRLPANQSSGRQCVIFNVTKDSRDRRKEFKLAHIDDAIKNYLAINPPREEKDENRILLLPMRQCRGFVKLPMCICNFFARHFNWHLQREHIVLVAVDLKNKKITTHDSQSKLRSKLYPDRVKDIAKVMMYAYQYEPYGMQDNNNLCGYFVNQYCQDYLKHDGKNCAFKEFSYTDIDGIGTESKVKYMKDHGAELHGEDKPEYQGVASETVKDDGDSEYENITTSRKP
jgi:hypothetical protein